MMEPRSKVRVRVRVLALALMLLLIAPMHAGADETVASLMERLIPRNQLQYGASDLPTFFRWYVPMRLSVVSRDDDARRRVERETIGPLLEDFRRTTGFDATLSPDRQGTNVLLIIGTSPRDDFQFHAKEIDEISKDPEALPDLTGDVFPDRPPCYRNWRFVKGAVETAILYAPSPFQDEVLSRKCVAVNFAVLLGLLGKPSDGQTITNTNNQAMLFTPSDKAALRVLYDDTEIHPPMTMAEIESAFERVLSRQP